MSGFFTLLKISLRLNFGISALKYRFTREKKKRYEPILIGLAAACGIGSVLFLYVLMLIGIFAVVGQPPINKPEVVLTLAFLLGQFFVLVFGIFYTMGSFYFSKDMDILVPLPLRPYEVLGSKFIVIMVNEYLTMLPILLPSLIIYGAGTDQGLIYWLKGIILLLMSPVIPLIIGALIIMVLMRFINFRKSKDLLAIIGGFFGLFLALGLNLLFSKIPESGELEFFSGMAVNLSHMVENVGRNFLPSIWATYGLSLSGAEGWLNFLYFVGTSLLLFVLLLWLGNKLFYKSILSGQEVGRKRKKLSVEESRRQYEKTASPVKAIFIREWKLLLRTPVFVLNGLAGTIIGPFVLIFMVFTGEGSSDFDGLKQLFSDPSNSMFVTLGGLALILFTAGVNAVSSTALSREGATFWFSKMIPVSARQQVMAKLIHAVVVSMMGNVIVCVALPVLFALPVPNTLYMFLAGSLGSVFLSSIGLTIDILRPKLEWKNPTEAMKQNMNAVLAILASIAILVGLGFLTALLISLNLPAWAVYLAVGIVILALDIASVSLLYGIAARQYTMLEA